MPTNPRGLSRVFAPVVLTLALAAAYGLPWLHAQAPGPVAPGGFLETATSTTTRPVPTAVDLAAFVPSARGIFTFPAPYNTTGIRLTTAADCGGADCVDYVGYSYWRNMNNSAGSNYLYAFVGLDRNYGGVGPSLFRYDKTTGETVNLGPILAAADNQSWASGEGWYFSATQPTTLYAPASQELRRIDVLSHASSVVFNISTQFGADKFLWQVHSSNDDRVHSFTLRRWVDYADLGCAVYREDTHQFSFYPRIGAYDECQIDKSGQWLLIKEDVDDGVNGEDNRIIDIATGAETILLDKNGAAGHSDSGFGVMVAADNFNNLPNAIRLWAFGPPPLGPAPVVYQDPQWLPQSMQHVSFANARSAPLGQQYVCGSAVSRINGPRANEVVCVRLDGSKQTLVVAPVMTSLDASGGGGDDYNRLPKGNLDPTGQYFMWTSNLLGSRLDAFIVRVPGQLLVPGNAGDDVTAPVVAITAPADATTAGGSVPLSASATDDVGVVGVQFRLDAATLGTEITTPPYAWSWNSATAPDGVHVLRAVARDAAGNTTTSVPVTVTVLNTPTGPAITGVTALATTDLTALVAWTTNQLASGQVEYGVTTAYGSTTPLAPALVSRHVQLLAGLTASTLYHFRITSTNAQGVGTTTGDLTFSTASPAIITGVGVSNITNTSVHISWTTDLPSNSYVECGLTTGYGECSGFGGDLVTVHGVDLTGLTAGRTYHFRVSSTTDTGVPTTSGDFTFGTLAGLVSGAAPGGFIETANSTTARPVLTAAQLSAMLPTRGPFAFPAPYNTTGVRLTNASDCSEWYDCVNSAWRNLNNSTGSNFLYAAIGLDRTNGGAGPSLFRFDKTTGDTVNLGPLFPPEDDRSWGNLDGWYFSATMPTAFYVGLDARLQRYDVLTHATSVVFDITAQFGDDKEVYHASSSNDDRAHAFTLRRTSDQVPIGCGVYREDAHQFSFVPAQGLLHDCQIDRSGQWLLVKEDRDGVGNEDNRIVDLYTGAETVLLQAQGAAGEADTGFGAMIAVDGSSALPNAIRRWTFGPLAPGPVVYNSLAARPPSFTHISFGNARSAPFDQQYICGGAVNRTNGPRANEVVCARLDGSLSTLVVAPVMTSLDALGGGPDDDVIKQPYGTLDPTGQFFVWTTNLLGDRLEAILVRVPSQLLVTPPADTTPPTVTITVPTNAGTVNGNVGLLATASDNVGVVSLQFKLDGLDVGPGLVSGPYTWSWDSTTTPDGVHVLTAIARDSAGNTRTSAPVTMTVMNTPAAPQISGVGSTSVTERLALVYWTTNQLADSLVEYGPTTTYGSATAVNAGRVSNHLQTLSGLIPGTTYHYRVTSANAQGLSATSGDFTFTTTAAPIITAVGVSAITQTSAAVSWTTDLPSDTMIEYGVTAGYGDATNADETMVTSHLQGLYSLAPGTTYHFRVYSCSPNGVMSVSGDFNFTTAGLTIGGVGASAITNTSALVSWTSDQAATSQVEYGLTAAYGTTTTIAGAFVTAHSQTVGGLAAGTTYHYRVWSTTAQGLTGTSGDFTFTTTGGVPPTISGVSASAVTGTTATIAWGTNQAADSQIDYGPTTAYGSQTPLDASLVTAHGQSLAGLAPGTVYHYRVNSRNGTGVLATSGDFTFMTIAPPVVGGVAASAMTGTTATIGWTTDQNADSQVEYGPTTAYGGATAVDASPVSTHSQALGGLGVGTLYHYRVRSTNGAGLTTTSGDFTFTTVAPPVVSGVGAPAITGTAATIGWTTDQPADSQVEYGLTTTYGGATALDASLASVHNQALSGLTVGTLYHYRVRSRNGVGLITTSGDFTFTTLAAPAVSGVAASAITGTTATIGWTTDQAADSQVEYGLTTAYGSATVANPALVTAHGQTIAGLATGTVYHYRVKSANTFGLGTTSGDVTLTTIAPPVISGAGVSGVTGTSATISWTTDQAADSQVEYGPTQAYGNSTTMNAALVTAHSQGLTGLAAGTTYHYRLRSANGVGLLTTSADATFTTVAPPAIAGVTVSAIAGASFTVGWTTDQPADTQVEYGPTTAYGSTTALNAALVTAHSQGLAGLTAGTTYHFRVRSTNGAGLLTIAGDFTATTTAAFVQSAATTNDATGTTIAQAFTSATTAGNLIVAAVSWDGAATFGCSDSQANVYTLRPLQHDATGNQSLAVCYAPNIKGGAVTVTATFSATSAYRRLLVHEYSGVATTTPFDVAAQNVAAGTTAANNITTTAATTTAAADLVFAVVVDDAGVTTITAGTNLTARSTLPDAASEDRVLAAAGSVTGTWTFTTAHRYLAQLIAFRPRAVNTSVAPVISGTGASAVTGSTATIGWTTDQPADSQVDYGPTTTYGTSTTPNTALVTTHSQSLTGLATGTTYHYRVRSTNTAGQPAASGDFTFTTATAPVISGVGASALTGTTAAIDWTTDQPADSQVDYGATTAYGASTPVNPALVTTHGLGVSGLAPATTYHYRVRSTNSAGLATTSADFTLATVAPPVISGVGTPAVAGTTATVGWTTDQNADSQVDYGLTTAYGSTTIVNSSLVTSHSQGLAGLATGTLYHYRVRSANSVGLVTTSADFTFTTVAPPAISGVTSSAITGTTATIGWTTDQTADSQVEYGLTAAYGSATTLDATLATGHSQTLAGLAAGTLYHYRVRSTNGVGLLTTSADFTFTTVAPPAIAGVTSSAITGATATVSWTTDQPADTQVDYGLTTAYGSATILDSSLVTGHSQGLAGLATGTLYHYRVRSTNGVGLLATSADATFTTVAPPVVGNMAVSGITGSAATVSWTTDQSTDSQVEYGLTTAYGALTTLDASLVTSHSQGLAGLAAGTTYHYRVRSTNSVGLLATSPDATFTTVAPPVISGVATSAVTGTAATVSWTTDQAANSQVEYGPTTDYGSSTAINASLVTSHSQNVSGLATGTLYHYRVKSTNGVGLPAVSADGTFTTVAPPVVSAVAVSAITGSTATIGWTTDQASNSQVDYGLTTAYGSSTTLNPSLVTTHSQGLAGLSTGTVYHYRVKSTNSVGLLTASVDATFTTVAPPVISGVAASGITGTTATIGWTTDQPADSQVQYGTTTTYGSTTTLNGTLVTSHSQGLSSLTAGLLYHYRVKSRNSIGLLTTSADFTFTTSTPPVISNVAASAITGTTATIGWTTNQPSDSQVDYGPTTTYGSSTTLNTSLVTTHSQGLSGLTTGTLYHFHVKSRNAAGQLTTSADFTFTTVAPPAVSAVAATAITGTTATIGWTTDQNADSQVDYGPTTTYGSTTTLDATLVTSHGQGLTGLATGTLYHYRVRSTNNVGLLTTSADATFTTVAPPVVIAVAVSAITGTTATVGWTTDQTADSQVEYGLTTAYGSTTALDPSLVTGHSQGLAGLAIGTAYHYRVRSTNSVGLLTLSADATFTTVAPPVISGVATSAITATTLTVGWTTDQLADSQLEYGPTTTYGSATALNATPLTTHSQNLVGLISSTTYHYRVKSTNAVGLQTVSADFTVTTSPPAFKQSATLTNDATGATIAQTFASATTAGNLIVAAVSWDGTAAFTCSDTQGDVFTMMPVQHDATGNQNLGICYAPNIKGGAVTVTATFSVTSTYRRLLIHEYSGAATSSPVDATAQNIANGTTAANNITTTAATATAGGDLVFAAVVDDAGVTTITAGTNYTLRASIADAASEDRVLAAAGSVTATWTFAAAHRYLAILVAFKGAGR